MDPHSVLTFLLISSDWFQLGNLNPDHTETDACQEKGKGSYP